MKSIRALQEIIFPSRCLSCGVLGLAVCSSCRSDWHPHIYRQWSKTKLPFPIYSSVLYSTTGGRVLLSAKENSLKAADEIVLSALKHSLVYFQREIHGEFLVPIPSRKSVARLRGRQFISTLGNQLSEASGLPIYENLRHIRQVQDQSPLDVYSRAENLDGALKSMNFLSGRAIVIDDLVTTGATLREAVRALRTVGIEVAGCVTACVAEPLR